MYIGGWTWLDEDVEHLARHGVTPLDVLAVWRGDPKYRRNKKNRAASHQMIGPDQGGLFFAIFIREDDNYEDSGARSLAATRPRQRRNGGNGADMADDVNPADEVLAHSEDEDEWEEKPEQIESKPSGTQVISARLPSALAEELLAEATSRGVRPSELVRQAVEVFMRKPAGIVDLNAYVGYRMKVQTFIAQYTTENRNLVVDVPTEPAHLVALGFDK